MTATSHHTALCFLQQNFDVNFLVCSEDQVEVHDKGLAMSGKGSFHEQLECVGSSWSFVVAVAADVGVTAVAAAATAAVGSSSVAVIGSGYRGAAAIMHWHPWRRLRL